MLATASTIAAIRMVSSPARQSRISMREASRSVFIGTRSRRRDAVVADQTSRTEREPARAATSERGVMRHEQQRRAVLVIEAEHEIDDIGPLCDVEIAGRLVGHQQLGLARERARYRYPLLLAA